jgi:exosortase
MMTTSPRNDQSRQSRDDPLPLLAISGLAIAFFTPVFGWLAHIWATSMHDAHGCLVPVIATIMLVAKRRKLAALERSPSTAGFVLVMPGMALMLVAVLMDLKMAMGVALIITLAGIIWNLWGKAVLNWAAFPLVFLLLMLPLNYPLEIFAGFPLRLLATNLTAGMLKLTGLDVIVQGTLISTPDFQLSIESACSGIKTLSAMLVVGMVLAYFGHQRWLDRMVIVLLLAPSALLANAVRNYCITLIGHYFGPEAAMGFLHSFSGLIVFFLSVFLLIVFSELLLWQRKRTSSGS